MAVTDRQVAALRALLVHDFDQHEALIDQLGDEGMRKGYFPLATSAFLEATKRRFRGKKPSDIVQWIAETRAERDFGDRIDPNVAERLLLWPFDQSSTDDIDTRTQDAHQTVLLGLLVENLELHGPDLDEFLDRARQDVDAAMSQEAEE